MSTLEWTLHDKGECMFCDQTRDMNPAAVRQWEDFRAKQARNGPSESDLRRATEAMPIAAAQWLREHADDLGLDPEGAAEAADELGRAVAEAGKQAPGAGVGMITDEQIVQATVSMSQGETIQMKCARCGATRTIHFDHIAGRAYAICPNGCDGTAAGKQARR